MHESGGDEDPALLLILLLFPTIYRLQYSTYLLRTRSPTGKSQPGSQAPCISLVSYCRPSWQAPTTGQCPPLGRGRVPGFR